MPYRRKTRRNKIGSREIRLFLVMCAIALGIGALLALFYGHGDDVQGLLTESLVEEYKHQTGQRTVAPETRRKIQSAVESATGKGDPRSP